MASAMAGVPASNRAGGSAYVLWSMKTSWIISPPPIHGGMVSSTSMRPHRNPMPVGPHILCPLATIQSTPSVCTSTAMCGTDWHESSSTLAPCLRASSTISATGASHPSTLLTCAVAISAVLEFTTSRSCFMSMPCVSLVSPTWRITAPVLAATSCHGTRLLWCSSTDSTISSPGLRLAMPHVYATRLMASLALRVNTISRSVDAFTNFATLVRAASYASVALPLRKCTPRCTLEL
mmetsp:Transcript_36924/g.91224  ORF Transcript_36924/g.91224 Transcript_36924/m.91224 type:complete len:236 (-) Transcript_36924:550-1257(-)